jgi:hypothetical protein
VATHYSSRKIFGSQMRIALLLPDALAVITWKLPATLVRSLSPTSTVHPAKTTKCKGKYNLTYPDELNLDLPEEEKGLITLVGVGSRRGLDIELEFSSTPHIPRFGYGGPL